MDPVILNPYTSPADLEQLLHLADAEQKRVTEIIGIFENVPTKGVLEYFAAASSRTGLAVRTLRGLHARWRAEGWTALVRNWGGHKERLPDALIQHWYKLQERFQRDRSARQAYQVLIGQWRAWLRGDESERLPGYATCPLPTQHGVPAGWSYENLMRHKPEKAGLVAIRLGHSAARPYAPFVSRTRVGMACGQVYMFDDLWHDNMVIWPGHAVAVRPLELCCIDVFSGAKVHWGMQPRLTRDDGTRTGLRESDMAWLVATLLTGSGYHPDGCQLYVEGGTATIREDMARTLYDLSNGKIVVKVGGVDRIREFSGAYMGNTKGNFRFKAHIESLHNLTHNMAGFLPGQTGYDRNEPTSLAPMLKEADEFSRFLLELPEEHRRKLLLTTTTWSDFMPLMIDIVDRGNRRTNHNLEGWDEAGLIVPEVTGLPAEQFAILPIAAQEALMKTPGMTRARRLSPWEVWQRGARGLKRLPAAAVHQILGAQGGKERTVTQHGTIEFRDASIGPGAFCYLARVTDLNGHEVLLKRGEKYLTYCSPYDHSQLHIIGTRGQYLGACALQQRVAFGDEDALKRQLGQSNRMLAEALQPMRVRAREITAGRIAANIHNADVLENANRILRQRDAERIAERVHLPAATADDMDAILAAPAPSAAGKSRSADDDLDAVDLRLPIPAAPQDDDIF